MDLFAGGEAAPADADAANHVNGSGVRVCVHVPFCRWPCSLDDLADMNDTLAMSLDNWEP